MYNLTNPLMKKILYLLQIILIILVCSSHSDAQRRRYPKKKKYNYKKHNYNKRSSGRSPFSNYNDFNHNITISTGYNFGIGNMSKIYNPTPGFYIGYNYRKNNMSIGGQIGYLDFEPKKDTFYIWQNEWEEFGNVQYSNLLIIPLVASWKYYLPINNQFELVSGFGLGYYYTKVDFTYSIPSLNTGASYSNFESKGAINPMIGFEYSMIDNIALSFYSQYNLFFSVGSTDPYAIDYNENLGQTDHYISTNLGLVFKF